MYSNGFFIMEVGLIFRILCSIFSSLWDSKFCSKSKIYSRYNMDIWTQMAERIIREQEIIIGPIAIEQAKKVDGLEVSNGEKSKK